MFKGGNLTFLHITFWLVEEFEVTAKLFLIWTMSPTGAACKVWCMEHHERALYSALSYGQNVTKPLCIFECVNMYINNMYIQYKYTYICIYVYVYTNICI